MLIERGYENDLPHKYTLFDILFQVISLIKSEVLYISRKIHFSDGYAIISHNNVIKVIIEVLQSRKCLQ